MTACKDFFIVRIESFLISATMAVLGMRTMDEWLSMVPEDLWLEGDGRHKDEIDIEYCTNNLQT